MKIKNIILCLLAILMLTGCDDSTYESKEESLKYTWWQTTDGYILWLLDDECYLSRDDKKLSNACKFVDNAYDTGRSVITICNSYATDCDKIEKETRTPDDSSAIFSTYGSFYYGGTVKH